MPDCVFQKGFCHSLQHFFVAVNNQILLYISYQYNRFFKSHCLKLQRNPLYALAEIYALPETFFFLILHFGIVQKLYYQFAHFFIFFCRIIQIFAVNSFSFKHIQTCLHNCNRCFQFMSCKQYKLFLQTVCFL